MKTLVIGGGMAGLTYAILAKRNGVDVTVVERNARVGRKISMSGNGKCNIGNTHLSADCYNGGKIVDSVLAKVSLQRYLVFLRSVGVRTYDDGAGRLYPVTDNANTVVDCFRNCAARLGVKVVCGEKVDSVVKRGNSFVVFVGGKEVYFDKVVLSCGSKSQADDTAIANIVDKKYLTATVPSLTPVRVKNMDGSLNGIRNCATVTLLQDGKPVAVESGEIQFKDYGLSGVCVFNLSAKIARNTACGRKNKYTFCVDLMPDLTQQQLANEIACNKREFEGQPFVGLLKNKIADFVLKRAANKKDDTLAHEVKNVMFEFDKLLDYSMSQVTSGGVSQQFVDSDTLALPDGIVVLGEALDVDGICGGYNLFFAAASAISLFE